MKTKNKSILFTAIVTFIFTALLSCGIFALADSVKFKLGITLKPSVYFALSLNINNTGEQWIFDNRPTNANAVVDWATVKNLTINLENDAISTANSLVLNVYNYNADKYMSFEVYDTAGGVLSTNKTSLKNIEYNTFQSLNLSNNAILNGIYTFKVVAEMYDTQVTTCNVYVNKIKYDVAYNGVDYVKKIEYFDSSIDESEEVFYSINAVKINGENFAGFSFNDTTNEITIAGVNITGDIEIYIELKIKYWDGSVATQFAGGDGTAGNPFLISNGQELAYFSSIVNSAATSVISAGQQVTISAGFAGSYLNLTSNIYLNNETFTNLDNGYVEVTDGVNTAYIGDGLNGTTMGTWYTNTSGTAGSYAGQLYELTTIGRLEANAFQGVFNGKDFSIIGMYKNYNGSVDVAVYGGLFGYANGATIKYLNNVNNYVHDSYTTGGICGVAEGSNIIGCSFNGNTAQNTHSGQPNGTNSPYAGTLVGILYKSSIAKYNYINGYSSAIYSSSHYAGESSGMFGGVMASCTIDSCYSWASIYGTSYVGSIAANVSGSSVVTNCYNSGNITSKPVTNNKYTGTIAALVNPYGTTSSSYSYITNCYNIGDLTYTTGNYGIIAYNYRGSSSCISSCYYNCYVNGTKNSNLSTATYRSIFDYSVEENDYTYSFGTVSANLSTGIYLIEYNADNNSIVLKSKTGVMENTGNLTDYGINLSGDLSGKYKFAFFIFKP